MKQNNNLDIKNWFDWVDEFHDGFGAVKINNKWKK